MATLKMIVLPSKPTKEGKFKIRIAVSHKQDTRYIITRFSVDSLNQFKNGQVVKRSDASITNMKLRNLLNEYQERLDKIRGVDLYDCKQLRDMLHNDFVRGTCSPTFQSVSKEYINELIEDGRESYATLLERNMRYFTEFTKGDFLISEITPNVIHNYSRFLKNTKKVGSTTVGMMMSRTRTIINRAKKKHLVKYEYDPFEDYTIEASPERELDISVGDFLKIRNSQPTERRLKVARDLFCLSYYLGGINLVDLLSINFIDAMKIEYIRKKSRNTKKGDKRISISIQPEAQVIIERWMNKRTGRLDFGYNFSYSNFSRYVTRSIKKLSERLGINRKVVYYSARKSFVQHGFELGIPLSVLEYCIGQSMKTDRPIYNYIRIMRKHADEATRKILDHLNTQEN